MALSGIINVLEASEILVLWVLRRQAVEVFCHIHASGIYKMSRGSEDSILIFLLVLAVQLHLCRHTSISMKIFFSEVFVFPGQVSKMRSVLTIKKNSTPSIAHETYRK